MAIIKKYYEQWQKEADKNAAELKTKSEAEAKRIAELFQKRQEQSLNNIRQQLNETAQRGIMNLRENAELKVLQSQGAARFKAKQEQLKLEEQIEIGAAEKTGQSVELVREKYRQKHIELIKDSITETLGYVQQAMEGLTTIFNAISQRENNQLEDSKARTEREKEYYDRLLASKKISREQYDKQIKKLNDKYDAEEKAVRLKQFKRDKELGLINAIINTAVAVTKAAPNIVLMALAGALGAIQIGVIASQKPPQYARGGMLNGPRHSNGGMPVVNPVTGSIEAEVEGGEAILSRAFVRNNPNLVAAALQSSKNGGYNIESPFSSIAVRNMNVPMINNSLNTVRRYESGGIMQQSQQLQQDNAKLNAVLDLIAKRLGQPLVSVVSLNTIEDAQNRRALIVEDATMK